jgi:hypothetical protein
MTTTPDDIAWEMAISDLHDEAVMARAAGEQAIFVFVEGDSEETALPLLLSDAIDMATIGVKIANYNGHGNLGAALRLLRLTLSHDRPVIVTHDNDPASIRSVNKCKKQNLLEGPAYLLPIPAEPVVSYSSGHRGGSFEESFPVETFLSAAFSGGILHAEVVAQRLSIESRFNPGLPWLPQLQRFTAELGFKGSIRKPALAEAMAKSCDQLPPTYARLVALIQEVRAKYPVTHPDDVELPRVTGLTHFPERE